MIFRCTTVKNYADYIVMLATDPQAARVAELRNADFQNAEEVREWFRDKVSVELSSEQAEMIFANRDALAQDLGGGGRQY